MRDIGHRLSRYRLSRYALPDDPVQRRMRWAWLALIGWLVWVGVLSDHSFLRLWKLSIENGRTHHQLANASAEANRLDAQTKDRKAFRDLGERRLREDGMARPDEIIYRVRKVPPESLLVR